MTKSIFFALLLLACVSGLMCEPYRNEPPPCRGCHCVCPTVVDPVCASNRHGLKTFNNQCLLDQENNCKKGNYIFQYKGVCRMPGY